MIFQRIRAYLSRKLANAEERSEVTKPGKPTIWNIKRATDRGNTDSERQKPGKGELSSNK